MASGENPLRVVVSAYWTTGLFRTYFCWPFVPINSERIQLKRRQVLCSIRWKTTFYWSPPSKGFIRNRDGGLAGKWSSIETKSTLQQQLPFQSYLWSHGVGERVTSGSLPLSAAQQQQQHQRRWQRRERLMWSCPQSALFLKKATRFFSTIIIRLCR